MHVLHIDRRDFLRRTAALGAALPFALHERSVLAAEPELISRRLLFDNPDYLNVRVSPDGRHLAYLAPLERVRNLWVAPLADPRAGRPLTRATDRNLSFHFRWAYTNRHLVYFQEHDGDENWRASSVDIDSGAIVLLTPERGVKALLQEQDRKFPAEVMIRHNQRDKRYFSSGSMS